MPARFPLILGFDVAGEVVAIGPEVSRFEPGDLVFGDADVTRQGGAYAELALAREAALAPMPGSLSFEEAAALPLAALTALQALRDKGELTSGEKVAINGASGGVGHFAVQIARALGAHVTAVAGGRNQDFLRDLGARETVDYEEEDFTGLDEDWDVIFDVAANLSYPYCEPALSSEGGIYVRTLPDPRLIIWSGLTALGALFGGRKRARQISVKFRAEDLAVLSRWVDQGRLRPVLQEVFPLEEIRQAHALSEAGGVRGKVGVRVG
jgi:NADPH:quinone reductase-like Zn-dependent oxidoreductase